MKTGALSALGRGNAIVAIADMFLSCVATVVAARNVYHRMLSGASSDDKAISVAVLCMCTALVALATLLCVATIRKIPSCLTDWLYVNYVLICGGISSTVACLASPHYHFALQLGPIVVARMLQCVLIKECQLDMINSSLDCPNAKMWPPPEKYKRSVEWDAIEALA